MSLLCCFVYPLFNLLNTPMFIFVVFATIIYITLKLLPRLARWSAFKKHGEIYRKNTKLPIIAFFHPYCNAGGGGERVLWTAVKALQERYDGVTCIIYTGDSDSPESILKRAAERFNIRLFKPVHFIYLSNRRAVESSLYPIFTLLGQSLGSMVLALEALFKFVPDIYIDSMGYAFSVPLFRYIGRCTVLSYVHYPTISTDMLTKVTQRIESFNNSSLISRSRILTKAKLIYYRFFAYLYGKCGVCNHHVMVNSTWTYNHIEKLWRSEIQIDILYPPCDVNEFLHLPLGNRQKTIVSVAQFRPEKDHILQIRSFKKFLSMLPTSDWPLYKLILVGSCRDELDEVRVNKLRDVVDELKITDNVDTKVNISFEEVKEILSQATVGLHTMKDEHFGIGVVECMAAGTVTLAHNSGGPKLDIVREFKGHRTGFLATTEEEYALSMKEIFTLSSEERQSLCQFARQSLDRFSSEKFMDKFIEITAPFMTESVKL